MAISNDDLLKLVKILPEEAKQSAYDYLKYLTIGHRRPDWDEIDLMEPDDIPLSEEEERQMNNNTEFVSWEDAMHELNLPTDIKP
ncbi:hypothetical protein [Desulfosporosinus youngiae]|uniref:Uncharacterized protein n=1 Tax=Desulfosporosinus youngiae DSM 17734 TaxID=768710 RepID=H5Y4I8_9FIRM|nr:hypothetical protein [Desulfosporosinus youngiae]EHQ89586.1 hypothetical protein DesyoDRAFT_2513 [Desulfosporosinus youngiae DSM 17734]